MTNRCRARIAATIGGSSGVILRFVGLGFRVQLLQDLLDAVLSRDRAIVEEAQLGSPPEPQPGTELATEEWRRALEGAGARVTRLVVAQRRLEHPRQLQVRADLDAGQRHEPDPRIVHLAGQQQRELAADLIGDTFRTGTL